MENLIGKFVIVRTYSAGVHMGTLVSSSGREVTLSDARRLWRWTGAFTLSEASQNGVGEDSRISQAVPTIVLLEAIEIIPCSDRAAQNLSRTRNA